jgi:hypothetical protein
MEQEGFIKPIRVEALPELDDDEFCVSITKAAASYQGSLRARYDTLKVFKVST